ncbi:MAG TPA: NAD-dependent epimerase/dehydratase family protein [Chryseosolibacter sp.]
MKIRAIITGVTGMVGEGVLHESLNHPDVESVLVINRRPCGVSHPKLKEIIHADFHNFTSIESHLTNYNACFFCLGVSSVGMKEAEYTNKTYDLTLHVASTLARLNPDMTFCYVSGAGTDSSEKGRSMWARVKGRTENALLKLPFKKAYMFRPGFIEPTKGLKNTLKLYRYIGWLIPVVRVVSPSFISTLRDIGLAMIHSVTRGYPKPVLEVPDIKALAK